MKWLIRGGIAAGLVMLLAFAAWKLYCSRSLPEEQMADVGEAETSADQDQPSTGVVTLTDEQLKAASMRIEPVARHALRASRLVPGRLKYDDRRHVEIRIATGGILSQITVQPGDQVYQGQVLAELHSSEVGHARADVLRRSAELQVARQKRDWGQVTYEGLEQLAEAIRARRTPDEIRTQFRKVSLGTSREKVFTTYSQLLLAESLLQSAEQGNSSGVMSRRTLQERQAERDTAEASLLGTMEQLLFDAAQNRRESEFAVEDAERRLTISRQNVTTLLGSADAAETADPQNAENLSLVRVRAPFAGTIEQKRFAVSERVVAGDSLFVLADTSQLWVSADLRDRDREALAATAGEKIDVFLSPSDSTPVIAEVIYVGREVDPTSNSVPLVASIDNSQGMLRPGMYVRVRIPVGETSEAVAVPEAALAEHESQSFLFVADDRNTFRRVDVVTGQRCGDLVEILSGINAGDQVVVAGTFGLKSSLLLQGEEP